tara:strand:- start:351 stop:509 length:159 start_codon:yes stop_codon:yes gene_type:complete
MLGCYLFTGSVIFFLDAMLRPCCCGKPKETATPAEEEGLLANEEGEPITKAE